MISTNSSALRHEKIANQLFFMQICELGSCLMLTGLGARYFWPNFNQRYSIPRIFCKVLNLIFQMLVPIVSMIFNPHIRSVLNNWWTKFITLKSILFITVIRTNR
jgi:hypothetical protein